MAERFGGPGRPGSATDKDAHAPGRKRAKSARPVRPKQPAAQPKPQVRRAPGAAKAPRVALSHVIDLPEDSLLLVVPPHTTRPVTKAQARALSDEVASGSSSESAAKQTVGDATRPNVVGHGSKPAVGAVPEPKAVAPSPGGDPAPPEPVPDAAIAIETAGLLVIEAPAEAAVPDPAALAQEPSAEPTVSDERAIEAALPAILTRDPVSPAITEAPAEPAVTVAAAVAETPAVEPSMPDVAFTDESLERALTALVPPLEALPESEAPPVDPVPSRPAEAASRHEAPADAAPVDPAGLSGPAENTAFTLDVVPMRSAPVHRPKDRPRFPFAVAAAVAAGGLLALGWLSLGTAQPPVAEPQAQAAQALSSASGAGPALRAITAELVPPAETASLPPVLFTAALGTEDLVPAFARPPSPQESVVAREAPRSIAKVEVRTNPKPEAAASPSAEPRKPKPAAAKAAPAAPGSEPQEDLRRGGPGGAIVDYLSRVFD